MSENEQRRLIDVTASIDIGQGYALAQIVEADGTTWPVLYDSREHGVQFLPHRPEHWRELAPHEMDGRLPDEFVQFRCGAPTHKGRPCRARVAGPGTHCRSHKTAASVHTAAVRAVRDSDPTLFEIDTGEIQ